MVTPASKRHTALEQARVKTAKLVLCIFVGFGVFLAVWHCVEELGAPHGTLSTLRDMATVELSVDGAHSFDSTETSVDSAVLQDNLGINQQGITFAKESSKGTILWYQSTWGRDESKALIERALTQQGWWLASSDEEQALTFVYSADAVSGGGCILVTFYELVQGCSILIEMV